MIQSQTQSHSSKELPLLIYLVISGSSDRNSDLASKATISSSNLTLLHLLRYKRRNIKELHKALHRCHDQLQQFSHNNERNFRKGKLNLMQEMRELISVHDQRKDESIERTFKGVARHFREVFSELVPRGHGHLVMMKKKDGGHDDDEDDEDGPRKCTIFLFDVHQVNLIDWFEGIVISRRSDELVKRINTFF
ncbi:hypothetical protein Ahy_B02g057843 [Arachis hypogaea]|uniref:Uncharacterized protein n=1 Tax=Arachis hypogaea TaxID=3818 RepID=A0A445ADA2_ARAHY|nr:hypothetical protein Ahy_B02g057843 [Arachis hypogaea]